MQSPSTRSFRNNISFTKKTSNEHQKRATNSIFGITQLVSPVVGPYSNLDLAIRVIVSCIRVRHEFTRHEFGKHEHDTNFNSCLRY
ncbi:hypothetical protein LXL04_021442 [Taraxacum kok-saghyz]